jgi:1-acyl-sn-glycerol-3-phosphate acyltransferase
MRPQKFGFRTEQQLYRWAHRMANVIFGALGNLESHGNENIPRRGGALLMSNHLSYLDPIIIGAAANREIHYMTRHDVFEIPILGRIIVAFNAFPVKRGAPDVAALRRTIFLLKSGKAVLVFPEGTRSVDGALGKAHDGASFIAFNANVPTIPAYLKGPERLMPRNARWIRPAQLTVTFGPPIDFTAARQLKDRREAYHLMGEQIMQSIAELRDARR